MGGRPKSNIGMTWQKFSTDPEYGGGDKYDLLLSDSLHNNQKSKITDSEMQKKEKDNAVLLDIVKMNFAVIWQEKGQTKVCKCGSEKLSFKENIPIKYHKDGKVKKLFLQGKVCNDCDRKYLVRKMLLEEYHKIEG